MINYTVRRAINDGITFNAFTGNLDPVVSRHRTLNGAMRSLERQWRGARSQGGYSKDYIWDESLSQKVNAN